MRVHHGPYFFRDFAPDPKAPEDQPQMNADKRRLIWRFNPRSSAFICGSTFLFILSG
jgi:hypothetical protein